MKYPTWYLRRISLVKKGEASRPQTRQGTGTEGTRGSFIAQSASGHGQQAGDPEHRVQAEANLRRVKRDAHQILERPDAAHLLLSPDEIQPWVPIVSESFARTREQFPDLATPSPSAAAGEAFVAAIFPLVREMVAKLFTPERIGSLTAQLKAYRNERFAAGDKKIAELANGAIIHVKDEDEPDCNIFLCALGYLSLIRGSKQMAAQLQAPAPSPDEPAG